MAKARVSTSRSSVPASEGGNRRLPSPMTIDVAHRQAAFSNTTRNSITPLSAVVAGPPLGLLIL